MHSIMNVSMQNNNHTFLDGNTCYVCIVALLRSGVRNIFTFLELFISSL